MKRTMDMAQASATKDAKSLHPAIWAAGFTIGMAVTGYLEIHEYVNRGGAIVLMALFSLLLIPMIRSVQRRADAQGVNSPALQNYNRRFMVWTFGYMAALTIAISMHQKMELAGPMLWVAGLLPALPVFGMIWTMARYIREEEDEYLRLRAINAALIATGILLAAATAWGFLEMFGAVPHVPSWAALPFWAIGLGIGQCWQAWRA
jgi:hypothetical protein